MKMAADIAKKMTRVTLIALKMLLKFIRGVFIVIQFLIGLGLVGVVIIVVLMVAVMGACILFMMSVTTDESTASVGTTISSADATQTQTAKYKDIFWVGDSRTVGLGSSVLGFSATNNSIINDSMCASVGQGLDWFTSDAITSKRNEIYALKGYNVIFNLGVNDYSGADQKYIDFYNNLPEDFIKNNNVCVMSVNPINATMFLLLVSRHLTKLSKMVYQMVLPILILTRICKASLEVTVQERQMAYIIRQMYIRSFMMTY